MIRVLVVDDQALVRRGLRLILSCEPDLEVVAEAADGLDAVARAHELRPHVALMDLQMPRLDGVQATQRLLADGIQTRVLVLTTFGGEEHVYAALKAGASGFLLKTAPPDQLVAAVRTVAVGDALLDPAVMRRLIEDFVGRQAPVHGRPAALSALTDREVDVMRLAGQGLGNREVARALSLSEATVKTYLGRILQKLALRDRAQLVVAAYESGLVRVGG
jgi:DNA-binding NarL/FixJ family response regulator